MAKRSWKYILHGVRWNLNVMHHEISCLMSSSRSVIVEWYWVMFSLQLLNSLTSNIIFRSIIYGIPFQTKLAKKIYMVIVNKNSWSKGQGSCSILFAWSKGQGLQICMLVKRSELIVKIICDYFMLCNFKLHTWKVWYNKSENKNVSFLWA